jgi:hypothetical protein
MNSLIDSLSFMFEAVSHGPVYALALSRIRNLQPLDPDENVNLHWPHLIL